MNYISTRGEAVHTHASFVDLAKPAKQFCDILLEGLAPDGGLYLPQTYPVLSEEE